MFSLAAFACQQNYANINGWLSTNIGGRIGKGHWARENPIKLEYGCG